MSLGTFVGVPTAPRNLFVFAIIYIYIYIFYAGMQVHSERGQKQVTRGHK